MSGLRLCWFDFENDHTCTLPEGHDEPHKPTSDDDIIISLAIPGDRNSGINITVPANE